MEPLETTVLLEGPEHFLDIVYETIDGHIRRTGDEYQQVITGVGAEEVGDPDQEEESVLRMYVSGAVDRDDAREQIDLALNRIADQNNMDLARESVQVSFEDEEE